jgi:AraC-like DNA-binding protein
MPYQPLSVPPQVNGRVHLEKFSNPLWRQLIFRHAHRYLEAHLVVRGRAVVVAGNQRIDLPTGSLLWIPPTLEHLTLEASPTLQRWCFSLRISAVRRALTPDEAALLLSKRSGAQCGQLARVELQALARVFSDVAEQHPHGTSVNNAGLAYALTRAVLAFGQAEPSDTAEALHPAVARALTLMNGDGLQLSRTDLAARCRISTTHLSRLFVQELGQSLRDVRSRKRLARFQQLMATGACDSLTEAALEAGFGSYSQFHRVFRRMTGRSPSQWNR